MQSYELLRANRNNPTTSKKKKMIQVAEVSIGLSRDDKSLFGIICKASRPDEWTGDEPSYVCTMLQLLLVYEIVVTKCDRRRRRLEEPWTD